MDVLWVLSELAVVLGDVEERIDAECGVLFGEVFLDD
jgi:hypothetical protein